MVKTTTVCFVLKMNKTGKLIKKIKIKKKNCASLCVVLCILMCNAFVRTQGSGKSNFYYILNI